MKNNEKKSLLGQVAAKKYDATADDGCHSPAMTIENIKRLDKILAKMRKAGISDEEIDFLGDFIKQMQCMFKNYWLLGILMSLGKKA